MDKINKLVELYEQSSKHSNYQILPRKLTSLIGEKINIKSRFENERLEFILNNVDVSGKKIIDIGGNTGFFSFELIENGAKQIDYFEGNKFHANFVQLAANLLGDSSKIQVNNSYLNFEDDLRSNSYDIMLLLNVLHHFGDDYGDKNSLKEIAKRKILNQLNSLADKTNMLIFQLGFNWKGNRNLCLFEEGTKKELIDYILNGTKDSWVLIKIGIAEKVDAGIKYNTLNENNIQRDNSLGEFLNRPIFILKSKKIYYGMG